MAADDLRCVDVLHLVHEDHATNQEFAGSPTRVSFDFHHRYLFLPTFSNLSVQRSVLPVTVLRPTS